MGCVSMEDFCENQEPIQSKYPIWYYYSTMTCHCVGHQSNNTRLIIPECRVQCVAELMPFATFLFMDVHGFCFVKAKKSPVKGLEADLMGLSRGTPGPRAAPSLLCTRLYCVQNLPPRWTSPLVGTMTVFTPEPSFMFILFKKVG